MKKIKQIFKRFLFSMTVFIGFFAAAQNDIKITEIKFLEPNNTFQRGAYTLEYKIFPEDATNKNLLWASDNPEVIFVKNGVIYVKKVGSAIITAISQDGGDVSATFNVIGVKLIRKISFDLGESIRLRPDPSNNYKIPFSIEPFDATNKNLKWKSSDESVVFVTQGGEMKTLKTGSSIIRATAQDGSWIYAELYVDVVIPVEKVVINEGDITLPNYASKQLTVTIFPADAPIKGVRWRSSNPRIATVDSNGMLYTMGENGEVTITASSDDKYAGYPQRAIKVTVKKGAYLNVSENSPKQKIQAYPNPADKILNIINPKNGANKIEIYNATGVLVLNKTFSLFDHKISLDVGNLPKGIYIYKIGNSNSKFLKN